MQWTGPPGAEGPFVRQGRRRLRWAGLFVWLVSVQAGAIGLGDMTLTSPPGQPLEAQIPVPPSIREARRTLQGHVRVLQAVEGNGALGDLKQDLVISTREYLRAELPALKSGDTPKDILRHIEGLDDGGRKTALATLASRLVEHHAGLELGDGATIANPKEEARLLEDALAALRPHVRLWRAFTGMFDQ